MQTAHHPPRGNASAAARSRLSAASGFSGFSAFPAIGALWISAASLTAPLAQTHTLTVTLSPNQAESGKAFQVTLSGISGLCAPIFSRHVVTVDSGVLNLTVMGVNNPAALCAIMENEYQTDFSVPALKAGKYEVAARLLPACSYETPPCLPARDPVEYGTLEVLDSASLYYAFRPKRVDRDKAFDLFVFNKNFTCGTEFSPSSTTVSGHSLTVSFSYRLHPEAVCLDAFLDHGPTFHVPAMPSGVYQVFTVARPYCGGGAQGEPCILAAIQLSGALTVGEGAVSLRPAIDAGAKEPLHGMQGKGLSIDTRHGVRGWWHAAAVSLVGRKQ